MSEFVTPIARWSASIVEAIGVLVIVLFAVYGLVDSIRRLAAAGDVDEALKPVRNRLGRGILLGLELLVAADIIHTVAVELTFQTIGVLAIIVAIRTFLSFTLEVEITGRWPWQQRPQDAPTSGNA